jgi:hypothetical protein
MIVLTTCPKTAGGNSAWTITLGRLVVFPTPSPNRRHAT